MKFNLFVVVFISAILLNTGCRFTEPSLTGFKSFSIADGPNGKKSLKFEVQIKNPNRFGFKLQNPACEILLNDKKIGTGYTETMVKVKPQTHEYHPVYLQTDITSLGNIASLAGSIFQKGEAKLTLKGTLRVKKGLIGKNIAFNESKSLSFKDLLNN
jgi:LEA14-like dessication related protein